MQTISQSPTDFDFVQDPYPFYDRARGLGDLVWWDEYAMPAAFGYDAVSAVFRDRRFGREIPAEAAAKAPPHLEAFYRFEGLSLLEAEPPRHTRLRSLVLRAFTSRRIAGLETDIAALADRLIDDFPDETFDLLPRFCTEIPVIVIARLLGVPDAASQDLLYWSHAMVAMYEAGRTRATEEAAEAATRAFTTFISDYVETRRSAPANDLITELIAAEEDGTRLSTDELVATCILLLNAGHEATVHALGNGVKAMIDHQIDPDFLSPGQIDGTVEEILRFDPPLHMFTRYAYEDMEVLGHPFKRGDQVALVLGAANRDPAMWAAPNQFDPARPIQTNTSFGAGLHFCVGAPLARLEMKIGLSKLFARCPNLRLAETPVFADRYHFHGLDRLMVET